MSNTTEFSWEEWICGRIKKEIAADPAMQGETAFQSHGLNQLTREEIDTYQALRLRRILNYAYSKSLFYRSFIDSHTVKLDEIRTLADMKYLPMVQPNELTECPEKLLCVSLAKIGRIFTFTTSGTIGSKKRVFFTNTDLGNIIDFFSAAAHSLMHRGSVFQVLLPGGRYMDQADLLRRGIEKAGGKIVMANGTLTAQQQLDIMQKHHSQVIIGTVSSLHRLSEQASSYGCLKNLGIKALVGTSEHLPDVLRKRFTSLWNCEVYGHYGLTEMGLGFSLECKAHQGYHINEADFIVEVIDPVTEEVLPDGKEGELIITTLLREGMPLIRYRTHDIGVIFTGRCSCGANIVKRIGKIKGRCEKILNYKGLDFHTSQLDECIFAVPGVIDYEITSCSDTIFSIRIEAETDIESVKQQAKVALRNMLISKTGKTAAGSSFPEIEILSSNSSQSFI